MCRPAGKIFVNIEMNENSNSNGITHTTGIFLSMDKGKNYEFGNAISINGKTNKSDYF